MSEPASPRAVVGNLLEGLSSRTWEAFAALYAEDAAVEHPFAVPAPSVIHGRAALCERFASAATRPFQLETRNVVTRENQDPEVVVVEYDYHVTVDGPTRSSRSRRRPSLNC